MAEHHLAGQATEGRVVTDTPPRARHRKAQDAAVGEGERLALAPFVAIPADALPAAPTGSAATSATETERSRAGVREPTADNGSAERKAGRDPLVDNAKFLAIALVVVGHAIQPLSYDLPLVRAAFFAIYTFHMPLFILIAGYLSRSFTGTPRQARRLIGTIVVPYLVFEVSYEIFNHFAADGSASVDVLDPSFAMWFLCGLFVWRVTTPLWRALRPTVAVTAAVCLSLTSGMADLPQLFDVYRILGFLPYFVLGLVLPGRYFKLVRSRPARVLAVPTLLAPFFAAYFVFPDTQFNWLYYTFNYEQMGVGPAFGAAGRALMLLAGFAALTAFLALTPRKHMWFTALGAGTLYVYLLHRYVTKTAEYSGIYANDLVHSVPGAVVAAVAALVVTLVLSSSPIRTVFRPFVEPRLESLVNRQRRTGGHRPDDA